MSTLNATHPTLLDVTKRMTPDGGIDDVVELLRKKKMILQDAVWLESNLPTGHRSTQRTGLPAPSWRKINQVGTYGKSTTAQITDTIGMLDQWAQVDVKAAGLNGNSEAWRFSEEAPFIDAMGDEIVDTMFNGNENTEPEAFTGFGPRYNDNSGPENAENILVDSSSDTDACSAWLIDWSIQRVCMLYPKGTLAGLQRYDYGVVVAESHGGSTGPIRVYRSQYCWDAGLHVRDWRGVGRYQLDLDDVVASGATGPVISDQLRKLIRRVAGDSGDVGARAGIYCNRAFLEALDLQSANKGTLAFSRIQDANGVLTDAFMGISLRQTDAITENESSIT